MDIAKLNTEQRNPASQNIDRVPTLKMVEIVNNEDAKIAGAIRAHLDDIAKAIDAASVRYKKGGRLIYIGAGTSGRLGILDATELVPTFGITHERAFGLIAGGQEAMFNAVEGAEDDPNLGRDDLKDTRLSSNDIVIGIAASGRTPYVIGGLEYAQTIGALTIAISCNVGSEISTHADIPIEVPVGPEVVTGSTRMKAGTAQKMILNMLSTGVMIKNGKVYENLMINVQPTNSKLVDRGARIISQATGVSQEKAAETLHEADNQVNVAIVMIKRGLSAEQSQKLIHKSGGLLSKFLD